MRLWLLGFVFCAMSFGAKTLDLYFIDVEGGQATLIVSPSGESMLVDAGWPGFNGRDSSRIADAAKQAGLKQIDYFVATHYHLDHIGGVPEIAARIPIIHFVDHGPSVESGKNPDELFGAYKSARDKGKHIQVKAGDRIPIKGIQAVVVSAAGDHLEKATNGGGAANPLCASKSEKALDKTENARSVGVLITLGKFRFLDLGDLTWNKENELVCPNNLLGSVDLYLTTHHGMDASGPETVVHGIHPRVAVMNNGATKGGSPDAFQVLKASPGLQDVWQVHYSLPAGKEFNGDEKLIANVEENCKGYGLKVSANGKAEFTVTNSRNQFSKTYRP